MKQVISFLAVFMFAGLANAEGFYAGGAVGFGSADYRGEAVVGPISSYDDDQTVAAIKGVGGYRVNRYFALEISLLGAGWDGDNNWNNNENHTEK